MLEIGGMPTSNFDNYERDLYDSDSGWHWAQERDKGFPDAQERPFEEAKWDIDNFKYYGFEVSAVAPTPS